MASVARPDPPDIIEQFGLLSYADAETRPQVESLLETVLPIGEAWVALKVTSSTYTSSSLSSYQAEALQRAVAAKAMALFMRRPQARLLLGTYPPLLPEDPQSLADYLASLEAEADELANLAATGTEDTVFSRPSFASSTFTYTSGDRIPSERNRLIDESDDISTEDLTNG